MKILSEILLPRSSDGVIERQYIAEAVGFMERVAGEMAGISGDRERNKSGAFGSRQLDCRAESVNTTSFLMFFQENDLLEWNRVSNPAFRGIVEGIDPHNTAVIIDRETGEEFAVDSWFFDNGTPPVIVPLELWLAGYDPDDGE